MPTEEGQKLRHSCSICCRAFGSKRDLVKHQYMHREKPKLICTHCNKSFTTESNYRRHLNSIQNNKKRYVCSNCGKHFRRLRDLEAHHETEHRAQKVFRCKVCQAEFSWHENLLKHEQVHEVNPHVCVVCSREFIDMTSLLVHRRTHHLPSKVEPQKRAAKTSISPQELKLEEKPFTCHICGRGFKFDFSYQAHLGAHVIPVTENNHDAAGSSVSSHRQTTNTPKPLYVQMDSEGIIDLPAFNSASNEEIEIIVEVGNISTPGAVSVMPVSSESQGSMAGNDQQRRNGCRESGESTTVTSNTEVRTSCHLETPAEMNIAEGSSVKNDGDKISEQLSSEQAKIAEKGTDSGKIVKFCEPKKTEENEGPPNIDKMDVDCQATETQSLQTGYSHSRPYSSRPKKPPKRKRERTPFQFNCIMTDDKPYICSVCEEAFRWEISLQVHTKVHTDGKVPGIRKMYASYGMAERKKDKRKNGTKQEPGVKKSRIVYQRHSSDEEEEEDQEDMFTFGNDPEEEERPPLSYHGKKLSEKKLMADNADEMLEEYLAGGDSFVSDDRNSEQEQGIETGRGQSEERVLDRRLSKNPIVGRPKHSDGNGCKKAILRRKRIWRAPKQLPVDDPHEDDEEEPQEVGKEDGGDGGKADVHFPMDSNAEIGQSRSVVDVYGNEKDLRSFQYLVEEPCLMTAIGSVDPLPDDGTAPTHDRVSNDRVDLATAIGSFDSFPVDGTAATDDRVTVATAIGSFDSFPVDGTAATDERVTMATTIGSFDSFPVDGTAATDERVTMATTIGSFDSFPVDGTAATDERVTMATTIGSFDSFPVDGTAATDDRVTMATAIGSFDSFPLDGTAANDDRVAMAAAYSVAVLPMPEPVLIQNGFEEKLETTSNGQLSVPVCVQFHSPVLHAVENAFLVDAGTLDQCSLPDTMNNLCPGGLTGFSSPMAFQNETEEQSAGDLVRTAPASAGVEQGAGAPGQVMCLFVTDASSSIDEQNQTMSEADELKLKAPCNLVTSSRMTDSELSASAITGRPTEHLETEPSTSMIDVQGTINSCLVENFKEVCVYNSCSNSNRAIPSADDKPGLETSPSAAHCPESDENSLAVSYPAASVDKMESSSLGQCISVDSMKEISRGFFSTDSEADKLHLENFPSKQKYSINQQNIENLRMLSKVAVSSRRSMTYSASEKDLMFQKKKRGTVTIPCRVQLSSRAGAEIGNHGCRKCKRQFSSRRSLIRHFRRHRSVKPTFLTCTQCSKRFLSRASLERHATLHAV